MKCNCSLCRTCDTRCWRTGEINWRCSSPCSRVICTLEAQWPTLEEGRCRTQVVRHRDWSWYSDQWRVHVHASPMIRTATTSHVVLKVGFQDIGHVQLLDASIWFQMLSRTLWFHCPNRCNAATRFWLIVANSRKAFWTKQSLVEFRCIRNCQG